MTAGEERERQPGGRQPADQQRWCVGSREVQAESPGPAPRPSRAGARASVPDTPGCVLTPSVHADRVRLNYNLEKQRATVRVAHKANVANKDVHCSAEYRQGGACPPGSCQGTAERVGARSSRPGGLRWCGGACMCCARPASLASAPFIANRRGSGLSASLLA